MAGSLAVAVRSTGSYSAAKEGSMRAGAEDDGRPVRLQSLQGTPARSTRSEKQSLDRPSRGKRKEVERPISGQKRPRESKPLNDIPGPSVEAHHLAVQREVPADEVTEELNGSTSIKKPIGGQNSARGNEAPSSDAVLPKERSRSESGELGTEARRRGRKRALSPDGWESIVIEPQSLKMSELCGDVRTGRQSDRGRIFEKLRAQKAEKRRMSRRKGGTDSVDDAIADQQTSEMLSSITADDTPTQSTPIEPAQNIHIENPHAVQIRTVDGSWRLDESSTQVDRRVRDAVNEPRDRVEETDESRRINSASFGRREKSDRWDSASTDKFYEALSMWGTDFGLIAEMFPNRSRRQIKNKFNTEERKDPVRIGVALREIKKVDMEAYSEATGTTFREVEEQQKEFEKIREDFEAKLREEAEAAAVAAQEAVEKF